LGNWVGSNSKNNTRKVLQTHREGEDALYEIRIKAGANIFRIFCFFDEGKLVILLNGFQKKTQKTPRNEIEKALKLKNRYYEDKTK